MTKLNGEPYDPRDHEGQVWGKKSDPDPDLMGRSKLQPMRGQENPKRNRIQQAYDKLFNRKDEEAKDPNAVPILKVGEDVSQKGFDGPSRYNKIGINEKPSVMENAAFDNDYNRSFKSAVKGRRELLNRGGVKGVLKRSAPSIVVGIVVTAVGLMMGGTQALMPFSLAAQIKGQFDTIGASTNFRSRTFLRIQLDTGRVKNCVKANIFGKKKFNLSNRQIKKLANAGIDYDSKSRVMKFTDVDGVQKIVTADNFENVYNTNERFRSEYYEGSKTWRGAISDWFDGKAKKVLEFLTFNRNKYKERVTGDSDADDANFKSNIEAQAFDDDVSGGAKSRDNLEEGEDENHETTTTRQHNEDEMADLTLGEKDVEVNQNGTPKTSQPSLENKISKFSEKYGKVTGIVSAASQTICGVMNIVSAIGALVAAMHAIQVVKTAAAFLEVPDKQSSGEDTSEVPINSAAEMLLQEKETTYLDKNQQKVTRVSNAMSGESVKALYEGRPADSSDLSVRTFNFSTLLSSVSKELSIVQGGINIATSSFKACLYTRLAAAVADTVGDILETVGCIASLGIGCAASLLKSIGLSIAFSMIVQAIVKAAVPWVAQILARNVLKDAVGEDLGNAIVDGGMKTMSENHKRGGGSFMDEKGFGDFLTYQAAYQQEIARYERENLSPFDVSSQNTFLGSIVTKLVPVVSQTGSIFSRFSSVTNVISKSISGLMPNASAIDSTVTAAEAAERTSRFCPYIESVGAVADEYCNPYVGSDVSTMGYDPADVVNTVATIGDGDNLGSTKNKTNSGTMLANTIMLADEEGEENAPINEDSRLGRHIIFCYDKESPLGMPDQNIIDAVDYTSTGNSTADSMIGAAPIFGDMVDALSSKVQLEWYGYISGEACVQNNDAGSSYVDDDGTVLAEAIVSGNAKLTGIGGSNVPSWKEAKYYQRYVEDQRLAEASGLIEKSAVTVFLEEYHKKHPLDNSYEGILARRSGLRKSQVIALLDLMEYQQYLAEYNPEEMYPLSHDKEEKNYKIEDDNQIAPVYAILTNNEFIIEKRRLATVC